MAAGFHCAAGGPAQGYLFWGTDLCMALLAASFASLTVQK